MTPYLILGACALLLGALAWTAHRSADVRRRIGPFLVLLDARYLPLLFAALPQSFVVYAWQLAGGAPPWVATMGGIGFEAVYVGAIAWAEYGAGSVWTQRATAIVALLFSCLVAVVYHWPTQQVSALLHAGFPLVAFCYTLQMHRTPHAPAPAPAPAHDAPEVCADTPALSVQVIAPAPPPPHDAPALPEPVLAAVIASTHACAHCGAAVATQQAHAASVRYGHCASCKPKRGR